MNNMKILVTGGMGEIGRPTVQWLLQHGHTVRVLDRRVDAPIPGAECYACDVTDYAALSSYMEGLEGVIHLAAYRHPSMAPGEEMFRVNVGGTFNVFQAAAAAGIKRVVCASSINALGYNFGVDFPAGQLRYFPIDEEHPLYTTDSYSFSKQMIEEIGGYFWRREGVSSVFLRFPAVYDLEADPPSILTNFVTACEKQTAAMLALTEPARTKRVRAMIARFEERARNREWETQFDFSALDTNIMFGRSNFWTSLDVRDAAQAAEKGLLADFTGSHALYVTDSRNFVRLSSQELAAVFFPEVTEWKRPVPRTETLVSIARARALIGFEPAYSFNAEGA
ncbi:MAG TPA: NAD(P)-dependent oxidoreductase [Anaerolineae bacterium]|nr:NAD(P)-dependent oxidoreductase [Anaerolineae bacterium]